MRRKFTNKKLDPSISFLDGALSILKIIKIELFIALIALIISVGQYFQNSINARINITSTWRMGYTAENRDRVTRFIHFYRVWKTECEQETSDSDCWQRLEDTLEIFASKDKIFEGQVSSDKHIQKLVENETDAIIRQSKSTINDGSVFDKTRDGYSLETKKNDLTEDQYVEVVLKYRNAIIESLNTLEAVKAVIESKPLPFHFNIFYKDTLEGRYKDIIEELRNGLMDFIDAYRKDHAERETEAWHVLTSDESNLNDFVNILLYFCIFTIVLIIVYLTKTRMQKLGYLQEKSN